MKDESRSGFSSFLFLRAAPDQDCQERRIPNFSLQFHGICTILIYQDVNAYHVREARRLWEKTNMAQKRAMRSLL